MNLAKKGARWPPVWQNEQVKIKGRWVVFLLKLCQNELFRVVFEHQFNSSWFRAKSYREFSVKIEEIGQPIGKINKKKQDRGLVS